MPRLEYRRSYYADGQLAYEGMAYLQRGEVIPHGQGKKYGQEGLLVYEGEFADGNRVRGRWYYDSGALYYEGTFQNNKPYGQGRSYYQSGELWYEGGWVNDAREGYGVSYSKAGSVRYQGMWAGDQENGQGKWYYSDNCWYEGPFQNGRQCGQGRIFFPDGTLHYEGGFANGQRNGQGKEYYPDGYHYEGSFQGDQRSGQGSAYDQDGALDYQGQWLEGKRNGQGRSYFPSGQLEYEGQWAGNKRQGQGKLYDQAGNLVYEGEFREGKPASAPRTPASPTAPAGRAQGEKAPAPDLESALQELNSMIGLMEVKRQVNSLVNLIRVQRAREARNLPVTPITYHMVFTGNPGTGKTTVARLVGQIYAALGVVSKGNVVETDRTDLVGQYIGETAQKTDQLIQKALGGILFVDEAYALVKEGSTNDFGQEAIDCILKRMEDYRKDFVVIAAGYQAPMEGFLTSNPGLKSRFNLHIHFENYTLPELLQILEFNCKKGGYTIGPGLRELFTEQVAQKLEDAHFMETFSNGRYVRNLFDKLVMAQSNRLSQIDFSTATDQTLTEITAEDLQYLLDTGEFDKVF